MSQTGLLSVASSRTLWWPRDFPLADNGAGAAAELGLAQISQNSR